MAQIEEKGGDRSSTVDLNLVPFIDLMSVCIIFLLITAVWTQVSMIQLGSSIYGQKTEREQTKPPPRAEIPFRVDVRSDGYRVAVGRQMSSIPKLNGQFNQAGLLEELKKVKQLYPDKMDCVITMMDELPYEHLIEGMDALLTAGFPKYLSQPAGWNNGDSCTGSPQSQRPG